MTETTPFKVQGVLSEHIYGPVASRRYGVSLGINVLPNDLKLCSFNCAYCECGWTKQLDTRKSVDPALFPQAGGLLDALAGAMEAMRARDQRLDVVTFAGNGEPTLHPDFLQIAKRTADLRDRLYPEAKLILLSNATTLDDPDIVASLDYFDEPVMKLDAGTQDVFRRIDIPHKDYTLDVIVDALKQHPNVTIQVLFLTGRVDNTTPEEVGAWIERLREIDAKRVQIYTIERNAPDRTIEPVGAGVLHAIAQRVRDELGITADVYQ